MIGVGRRLSAVLGAAVLGLGAVAAGAQAAPSDPLNVFSAPASVPPGSGFEGPCGLAVDAIGNVYVSDYYHHAVDVFSPSLSFKSQLANVSPLNGPCGLAVDSTGRIYVNEYHGGVTRFGASPAFGAGTAIDPGDSTGVAVDVPADKVYVDARTHIAVYDSSGAPTGSIGSGLDGYGVAISRNALTLGRVYVSDAATDTVKVYDPATSTATPVASIAGPAGGFDSLQDSAVAIDNVSGDVYVADQAGSRLTERPESTIEVFDASGVYKGHLKYNVVDSAPVGLAVDNSPGLNQGRVYVTSGNGEKAKIYVYPPGAATAAGELAAPASVAGAQGAKATSRPADPGPPPPGSAPAAPAAASEVTQEANVRLDVNGQISPQKLPRKGTAPIAVEVGWRIATTDGAPPPKLKTLKIEINRAGRLDLEGLPTCPYAKIQPATTQRALSNCRPALVGRGSFSALISLAGQESYAAHGQMLVFNGLEGKKPVLFGQIYSAKPFSNSFVIPFRLSRIGKGTFGTALTATLPSSLRAWGSLTEIQMRLQRSFGYEGERHSFLSAGCPAPKGFSQAVFPLARTSFDFVGGMKQGLTLDRSCRARG